MFLVGFVMTIWIIFDVPQDSEVRVYIDRNDEKKYWNKVQSETLY